MLVGLSGCSVFSRLDQLENYHKTTKEQIAAIDNRIIEIDANDVQLAKKNELIQSDIGKLFDSIDDYQKKTEARIASIDSHIAEMDSKGAKLDNELERIRIRADKLSDSVSELRNDLEGWSKTTVTIPHDDSYHLVFGNSSGHHGRVTLTNRGIVPNSTGSPVSLVLVRKMQKPWTM